MRKLTAWPRPQGTMLNDSGGGPWGGRGGGSGGGSGNGGGGDGGPPRNPWNMPPEGGRPRGPKPGQGSTALDQLLRRSRARFGRGGLPDFGGRPIWAWALLIFLAVWIILTSVHRIAPSEKGVVLRFGRYVSTMEPGIGLTLPAPVDQVVKVSTEDRALDIGSTSAETENLLLTKDENLVNLAWTIRWNVADPAQYLFRTADPEALVRDVGESAMRGTVANMTLAELAASRADLDAQVAKRMQALLDAYHAGIRVDGIVIRQIAAPSQVAEASKKVAAAHQKAQSYLDAARTYAQQQVTNAENATADFDKVYAQYKIAPEVTRRRMYYDMMEDVLSKADRTIVDAPGTNVTLPPAQPAKEGQQ